jgi:hypothetical protein
MKTKPTADTGNTTEEIARAARIAIKAAARAALDKSLNTEKLALLAATIAHGTRTSANKVVKYAYELWSEAGNLLSPGTRYQYELVRRGVVENSEQVKKQIAEIAGIGTPRKFPATLKDFLRLIVNARNRKAAMERYQNFLSAQLKAENSEEKVESVFERDETNGFPDVDSWKIWAKRYLHWWKSERTSKAKISAHKRPAKEKDKKNLTTK